MKYFKFRWNKLGGHYHTAVFSANDPNQIFAKLGDIIMDESDFNSLVSGDFKIMMDEKVLT